ncbi:hypothetical protein LshimejAT787_0804680 [Lyophyllum shimeji]|uniref:Uncharacterized protein n=1 Tax=Lyophyllum shimeji TaxID=47721 RepID=A0A9P3PQ57_LYOSH|nr:hypothetical protein LshimejAT787_0804680 [Lyophyllum shimeji]
MVTDPPLMRKDRRHDEESSLEDVKYILSDPGHANRKIRCSSVPNINTTLKYTVLKKNQTKTATRTSGAVEVTGLLPAEPGLTYEQCFTM